MTKMICLDCLDIIESLSRHDFVKCKCGQSFVDGGNDYLRCGGNLERYSDYINNYVEGIWDAKKAEIPTDTIGS